MDNCIFCRLAKKEIASFILHEDEEVVVFLDILPIRPGHCQIIPKKHFDTFELLPPELAAKIMVLGQRVARRLKEVYAVERVAFAFTGGDVPHAHAHVIPLHEKTDVTSARYIVDPPAATVKFASDHLKADGDTLGRVHEEIGAI